MPFGVAIDASALLAFEAHHVRRTLAVEPFVHVARHRDMEITEGGED